MNDMDFEQIDSFRGNELIADPYPYYNHLRDTGPVQRERHHGVVMVTGYEEIVAVEADTTNFSACNQVGGPFPGFPVPLEGDDVTETIEQYRDQLPMGNQILTADPPRHTALRALVMRHFTPKRLNETAPFMHRLADRLIDEFASRGQCEFITEFSGPFALYNICELLGVPESEHDAFREELLGDHRNRGLGSTSEPTPYEPFGFVHDRFRTYVEECRAAPRDDVLTSVATTAFPDGSIPEVDDVVRLASTLFVAGTGTTAALLATAMRLLAENPDLQQLLRDEPERISNFIEETLRFESPSKAGFRLSRRSKMVRDTEITAGSHVMLVFSAGNRDPRKFESPEEFRVDRPNARQHLAFGHGIHSCAGAALARAEGRVSVGRLLDRLGDIKISQTAHGPNGAHAYEYFPSYMLRHLDNLHLEFIPTPSS